MFNSLKARLIRAICGLDVHKDSVYLCILNKDGELIKKVFGVLHFKFQQVTQNLLLNTDDNKKKKEQSQPPRHWIV